MIIKKKKEEEEEIIVVVASKIILRDIRHHKVEQHEARVMNVRVTHRVMSLFCGVAAVKV